MDLESHLNREKKVPLIFNHEFLSINSLHPWSRSPQPFQWQNHTLRTEVQVRNTRQVLCNGLASDLKTALALGEFNAFSVEM